MPPKKQQPAKNEKKAHGIRRGDHVRIGGHESAVFAMHAEDIDPAVQVEEEGASATKTLNGRNKKKNPKKALLFVADRHCRLVRLDSFDAQQIEKIPKNAQEGENRGQKNGRSREDVTLDDVLAAATENSGGRGSSGRTAVMEPRELLEKSRRVLAECFGLAADVSRFVASTDGTGAEARPGGDGVAQDKSGEAKDAQFTCKLCGEVIERRARQQHSKVCTGELNCRRCGLAVVRKELSSHTRDGCKGSDAPIKDGKREGESDAAAVGVKEKAANSRANGHANRMNTAGPSADPSESTARAPSAATAQKGSSAPASAEICDHCQQKVSIGALRKHLFECEGSITCQKCGENFLRKNLRKHMSTHKVSDGDKTKGELPAKSGAADVTAPPRTRGRAEGEPQQNGQEASKSSRGDDQATFKLCDFCHQQIEGGHKDLMEHLNRACEGDFECRFCSAKIMRKERSGHEGDCSGKKSNQRTKSGRRHDNATEEPNDSARVTEDKGRVQQNGAAKDEGRGQKNEAAEEESRTQQNGTTREETKGRSQDGKNRGRGRRGRSNRGRGGANTASKDNS